MTARPGLAARDGALAAAETLPKRNRVREDGGSARGEGTAPAGPDRIDDIGRHVGAGFGRRPSISRRMSANSRRGIATPAIRKVTHRPCRTTLAPILISFSRNVGNGH